MVPKIAVVTAFSERCIPLIKQFIVSCYKTSLLYSKADFHYFVYECNWIGDSPSLAAVPLTTRSPIKINKPFFVFSKNVNLTAELGLGCHITQLDASGLTNEYSWLPDIITYQDFCDHHMKDFDFVLFSHNDIVVNKDVNVFKQLVSLATNHSICCDTHLECFDYISARIYPHFVFTKVSTFMGHQLSWANSYKIFDDNLVGRSPYNDGGASLLASIYRKGKYCLPIAKLNKGLFHHLRTPNVSVGIETTVINNGYTSEVISLFNSAEKYVAENSWA